MGFETDDEIGRMQIGYARVSTDSGRSTSGLMHSRKQVTCGKLLTGG